MKQYKNTYVQDNNFKDANFSSGSDLSDLDLDIIESRSKTFNSFDSEFENGYWGEGYEEYTFVQDWNEFELQYNPEDTFQIGNNKKGGI